MLCSICVMGLLFFLGGGGSLFCFVFCLVLYGSWDRLPRSPSLLYPDKDRWKRMDGCWFCVCELHTYSSTCSAFCSLEWLRIKKLVDLSAKLLDYSQRGSDCDQKIATVGRFYMNYLYYATVRGLILAHKNGICLCTSSFRTKYNTVLKH